MLQDLTDRRRAPLVTVLTVVFNAKKDIESTILSVLPFLGHDVEYVLIDGGSTDGTLDVVQKYSEYFCVMVSEPDSGIYDAMNKGVRLASGVFVYHLNVGDRLLELPMDALRTAGGDVACVACCVDVVGRRQFVPEVNWKLRLHNTIHHQGCFYRRSLMPEYDTGYRVFSDFDLNLRIYLSGAGIVVNTVCVAQHDSGGVSNRTNRFSEVFDIVRRNCGLVWVWMSWCYFKWCGVKLRFARYVS